jgi:acetyl esterase/lipase
MNRVIFFFFLATFIIQSQGSNFPDFVNIDYGGEKRISQFMDIYLPNGNKDSYPVVIVIHGSGWRANNKKSSDYGRNVFVNPLNQKNFAVAIINHRSSILDSIFPAQIHDVKAAVRYLRAKAKDLNLDTSFIGITGYSSGGHLAALAGTSSYDQSVEGDVGEFLNFSSHIDAVVDFYGPTDMSVFDDCLKRMGKDFKSPRKIPLFDNFVDQVPKEVQRANPIKYIKENSPPFLIFHGENDLTVPICQSKILHEALLKKGINSELIIDKNGDHCGNNLMPHHTSKMVNFFSTTLKSKYEN